VYFGYLSLQSFTFLAAGFFVVMTSGIGLILVYAVGASRGRRAAELWVNACVAILVVGLIADIVFAVATRQWEAFLLAYGLGSLLEMGVLGLLFVGSMWFMALRYTQSLKK
jgi:threonine/homoserine/homoserine lactone efflux protein